MQFLIIAYDAEDAEAPVRRMAAREAHLGHVAAAKAAGNAIMGAAILDDDSGKMCGSTLIVEFPDRAAVERWLDTDPYIVQKVWGNVYIQPCQIAPSFVKK